MSCDIHKKNLTEIDICDRYITPAITDAGWNQQTQIRREYTISPGRIITNAKKGKRKPSKRADYILCYTAQLPLAVVEAKDNTHDPGDGMQQALEYARMLQLPFVFSSNGDSFIFHDKTIYPGSGQPIEIEISLAEFPSPDELWRRYCRWKNLDKTQQKVVLSDYHQEQHKEPRYYQVNAINNTVEAIVKGQQRLLLVMATGTGKTYTAFQIIWRLWKTRAKKRILFLADRNILVDQTMVGDFKPFKSAMGKLSTRSKVIERGAGEHQVETAVQKSTKLINQAYEIYLGLYQAVSGAEEERDIYKQLPRDFFDLVVIDECHRGSAKEDSSWREILEYFNSATQIGLTATPKETKDVSNIHYFNDPIYTYSLKQGIDDGFLAPYRVIRVDIDRDLQGWRPEKGKRDKHGQLIEDRVFNQKDYDRSLVLEDRIQLVARRITEYLKGANRYDKTIVFCEDIAHAKRMRRALVNLNQDEVLKDDKYIMRITGDNNEGKKQLDYFIDPESTYPVIAVTSKLMSTGVDAQTCKLIVLDRTINSPTEFKQIIGRGTRINEAYGKTSFTIMDFRKATERFADPDFDDDPVQIYEVPEDGSILPPDLPEEEASENEDDTPYAVWDPGGEDESQPRPKYVVDDVSASIIAEREQHFDEDGKLRIESMKAYTRKNLQGRFQSMDDFLKTWSDAKQREAIVAELAQHGVELDELSDEIGRDLDPFDLLCHLAYDQPPLTRRERADHVRRRNYFTQYSETAQKVLTALLDKYADEGVTDFEDLKLLKIPPIDKLGTPMELIEEFGNKQDFLDAVKTLSQQLYNAA